MSDRIAGKMCLCSDKDCAEDNSGDVTLIAAYSSIGRLKIIPTFSTGWLQIVIPVDYQAGD